MSIRQLAVGVLLAASTSVLLLLTAEVALRVYGYDTFGLNRASDELPIRPASDADPLVYELSPGFFGRAWSTEVSINSLGYRGDLPDGGEGMRIGVFGDSVAFGYGLPRSATIGTRLQSLAYGRGAPVEVMNFGVPGYDILQVSRMLEERTSRFDLDLAIVVFCLNDVGVVSDQLDYVLFLRRLRRNVLLESRLVQFIARRLQLYRMRVRAARLNRPPVFAELYREQMDPIRENPPLARLMSRAEKSPFPSSWYGDPGKVARLRFAMNRMAQVSKAREVPVLVALVPWLEGSTDDYPHRAAHRVVLHEAHRAGLPTLDLAEPMLAAGIESLRRAPEDRVHPNSRGASIIATELCRWIDAMRGRPRPQDLPARPSCAF